MAELEMVWALAGPVTHGWVHVILNSYSKTSMEQVFGLTPLEPQRPRGSYLSNDEGQGGFGRVALCKNKLDGRQYAVKKIRLKDRSPQVNEKILRFVYIQSSSIVRNGFLLYAVVASFLCSCLGIISMVQAMEKIASNFYQSTSFFFVY